MQLSDALIRPEIVLTQFIGWRYKAKGTKFWHLSFFSFTPGMAVLGATQLTVSIEKHWHLRTPIELYWVPSCDQSNQNLVS